MIASRYDIYEKKRTLNGRLFIFRTWKTFLAIENCIKGRNDLLLVTEMNLN